MGCVARLNADNQLEERTLRIEQLLSRDERRRHTAVVTLRVLFALNPENRGSVASTLRRANTGCKFR